MPKTNRDLFAAFAEKVGINRAERPPGLFEHPLFKDLKLLDEPIADDVFESRLTALIANWTKAQSKLKDAGFGPPGTWGGAN